MKCCFVYLLISSDFWVSQICLLCILWTMEDVSMVTNRCYVYLLGSREWQCRQMTFLSVPFFFPPFFPYFFNFSKGDLVYLMKLAVEAAAVFQVSFSPTSSMWDKSREPLPWLCDSPEIPPKPFPILHAQSSWWAGTACRVAGRFHGKGCKYFLHSVRGFFVSPPSHLFLSILSIIMIC